MPNPKEELQILKRISKAIGVNFSNITPQDKPDFKVQHQGNTMGIEVTDCSGEEFRRALTLVKKFGMKEYSMSGFSEQPRSQRRSNAELKDNLSSGDFTCSEYVAVQWAERVSQCIKRKSNLMQRNEIARFDKNWLYIYNFNPVDWSLDIDRYRDMLLGALGSDPIYRTTFDAIYIVSSDSIFHINQNHVIAYKGNK